MRAAVTAAIIIIAVLVYGFWHVSTYGWLVVSLRDVAAGKYEPVKNAELIFLDSDANKLAEGRSFSLYGVVYLNHPEVGFCVEEEGRGSYSGDDRENWYVCYEKQAQWIISWVKKAKYVDLAFDSCSLQRIPVSVVESKGDWWLWWVPLPHLAGKAVTNFYINIRVDRDKCAVEML